MTKRISFGIAYSALSKLGVDEIGLNKLNMGCLKFPCTPERLSEFRKLSASQLRLNSKTPYAHKSILERGSNSKEIGIGMFPSKLEIFSLFEFKKIHQRTNCSVKNHSANKHLRSFAKVVKALGKIYEISDRDHWSVYSFVRSDTLRSGNRSFSILTNIIYFEK